MSYIIFGLPGAGKGTVAKKLEQTMGMKQLSTGDLLRKEVASKSELGTKVEKIMVEGGLVSDDIVIAIIEKQLQTATGKVIFDGFPRTIEQAESLNKVTTIKKVLFLKVSDDIVIERLLNRTDENGNKRKDDDLKVIKNRIDVYYQSTKPILDYYQKSGKLVEINGALSEEEVFESCSNAIRD